MCLAAEWASTVACAEGRRVHYSRCGTCKARSPRPHAAQGPCEHTRGATCKFLTSRQNMLATLLGYGGSSWGFGDCVCCGCEAPWRGRGRVSCVARVRELRTRLALTVNLMRWHLREAARVCVFSQLQPSNKHDTGVCLGLCGFLSQVRVLFAGLRAGGLYQLIPAGAVQISAHPLGHQGA